MKLLAATVRRFRNVAQARLEPGPHATVLVGNNGEGKTNLLEAIHFLCTLKPLRAVRLAELRPHRGGEAAPAPEELASPAEARVDGVFELAGGTRTLSVWLEAGERRCAVDAKPVDRLETYLGGVAVVAFTPDDLALVKGAPELRRRFLDRAVFGRVPAYLGETREYLRALKARNRLLREPGPDEVREAFDVQVARLGARLWRRRLDTLEELRPRAAQAFSGVARAAGELRLEYRASGVRLGESGDEAALEQALAEALTARLPGDRERQFTSVGPHADDLGLLLDGKSMRSFASQGQQRAAVLALKIGEVEMLRSHLGRYPLLLLDDVSSELDPERNLRLMEYVRALDAQVLLSTTDLGLVSRGLGADPVAYRVNRGTLTRLELPA